MKKLTRAEFLREGGLFAAAMGTGQLPAPVDEPRESPSPAKGPEAVADQVVTNARVYTMDDAQPRAEAFAVHNGRFLAVGSASDIQNLVDTGTEVIDAAGMTVTPGFIDTHSHPSGISELMNVNANLPSIAEIKEAMHRRALETPPEYWVTGSMYDDTKLREGRPITRRDLDEAVPDHPAVVRHRGGHTAVYNSKAFELAGVSTSTPQPDGGHIYIEDGELTGLVAESARAVFDGVGRRAEITRETRQAGVKKISEEMTRAGLTSVHRTGTDTESLIAFQDAYRAGELLFRLYAFPRGGSTLFESCKAAGIRTGFGDEMLRIGAVKYSADGSASERTMYMSTPYVGRPDDFGILTMSQEEIHEAVEDAQAHGFQIGIHANGDRTIDMVLQAYERVQERNPLPDPRFRIEHCTLVNPDLLRRIKAIGAIPTPFYTYVYYHGEKWEHYGEERLKSMFAHRSFLDYDIPVPGASDYSPGPYEPMMALQSMVTRTDYRGRLWGANQRVTVAEALRICTVNGAYASIEENIKGSITAGKLADFVVLGQDPHEVDPMALKDIPVVRTVVGGRSVHGG